MARNNFFRIIAIIFIIGFLLKGLFKSLPFFIVLIFIAWVLHFLVSGMPALKRWFAKNTSSMIDHNKINRGFSFIKNAGRTARAIGALIILGLVLSLTVTVVPAGHVGVMDFFGKVNDRELASGIQFKIPFSKVVLFSTQTQDYTMTGKIGEGQVIGDDAITALTKEGLNLSLDITVLYHLDRGNAAVIYREIGTEKKYQDKIIRPAIRSTIREVAALSNAEALYSVKRTEATQKIADLLKEKLGPRGIVTEDVLLRNVTLPAKLSDAIEEKLKAEQESQRFDFVLEKEKKEADRKRIAAEGQRDSQTIINESLTDRYLQYLYIQELKDRQGTIYVPVNPQNGLPLFKGL